MAPSGGEQKTQESEQQAHSGHLLSARSWFRGLTTFPPMPQVHSVTTCHLDRAVLRDLPLMPHLTRASHRHLLLWNAVSCTVLVKCVILCL